MSKRYLVTSALPYANGPKHIGHLAGAYLPADIFVRHLRLSGEEVIFICGSDEHGTAIPIQAKKENTTPQAIIDRYHNLLKSNFEQLGISFDIYHRTSDQLHHQTAKDIFLKLFEKGIFTEEISEQYFDEDVNLFLADRYITGICPNCNFDKAFGDQCEKCGKSLSPKDLINPISTLSGKTPTLKNTKHWYLPLQNYEQWLRTWILEEHKSDWRSNTYGQCKSWIDSGLASRAMTRDLDWGVSLPIPDSEGKVMYVWFDAPIGYISATKALFQELANNQIKYSYPKNTVLKSVKESDWELFWKDENTELIHFIGKDNIVFHGIIFPVILKETDEFILPKNVAANEFLNYEGDKMSTSRQWSVEMEDYLSLFPDKIDELRFVLTSIAPETKDSEFTWKDFQSRVNNELVAIVGNFVNRVAVLQQKFFDGKYVPLQNNTLEYQQVISEIQSIEEDIDIKIRNFNFRDALFQLINIARLGNKFITEKEPWHLIKQDESQTRDVLNICTQICFYFAKIGQVFLPNTADKIANMFNFKIIDNENPLFGAEVKNVSLLYKKIEDIDIEPMLKKLEHIKQIRDNEINMKQIKQVKPEILFEDFDKIDIRVATIINAEKVEKADKLLKLTLDTGIDTRTVVSGIAEFFKAEDIIGKQVSVLVNLAPRKLRGIESQGMILMAKQSDGRLEFINPDQTSENGSDIS